MRRQLSVRAVPLLDLLTGRSGLSLLDPKADRTCRRNPPGELRGQAGTYVNPITSSAIESLATRRNGPSEHS